MKKIGNCLFTLLAQIDKALLPWLTLMLMRSFRRLILRQQQERRSKGLTTPERAVKGN